MQSAEDQSQTYSTADSSEPITEENIESCSATQNSEIDLDEYAMISEPSQKSKKFPESSQEKAQEPITTNVKGTIIILLQSTEKTPNKGLLQLWETW